MHFNKILIKWDFFLLVGKTKTNVWIWDNTKKFHFRFWIFSHRRTQIRSKFTILLQKMKTCQIFLVNFPIFFQSAAEVLKKLGTWKNELSKARSDILAWLHNINKSSLKWMCYHRWRIEKKKNHNIHKASLIAMWNSVTFTTDITAAVNRSLLL